LRAWLHSRPLVVRDKVDVHIHRIVNDGIELSVSLFLATSNPNEETRFREEINCEVLHQAEVVGLSVAPGGRKSQPAAAEGPAKQTRAACRRHGGKPPTGAGGGDLLDLLPARYDPARPSEEPAMRRILPLLAVLSMAFAPAPFPKDGRLT